MALRRPAAVAVHDDRDVRRQLLEVDLPRQRLVGRSWRNPRQELLKRHSGPSSQGQIVTRFSRQSAVRVGRRRSPTRATSIVDAHEKQAVGGAVGPALRAVARREHLAHPLRPRRPRPTSTRVPTIARTMWRRKPLPAISYVISRPDDRPEPGRGRPSSATEPRREHLALGRALRAAGRLERREVVAPFEQARGRLHRVDRQRAAHVPRVRALERAQRRRRSRSGSGTSSTRARTARETTPARLRPTTMRTASGRRALSARGRRVGRDVAAQREAGHLAERVDAGVGAPGAVHGHVAIVEHRAARPRAVPERRCRSPAAASRQSGRRRTRR